MFVWITINALGLGISLLIGAWVETMGITEFTSRHFRFPNALNVMVAGVGLGLLQWKAIDDWYVRIPIRWILGAAIGFWTIAAMTSFFYELSIWANFRNSLSPEQDLVRNVEVGTTAGMIGGAVLGLIQGWSLKVRLFWGIVNAAAWAIGWSVSWGINFKAYHALLYFPEASQPFRMIVQMGVLGLVAGFVSSVMTAVPLLLLLRREWMRF
ncbi:hypothetical protein ACQ4M3_01925 [Leptolyngbya sp. AN03gr2]|uniref:hypothetical protein n=1 Tax=unclassified Leptolyngbya TaxID=2650499 RepID=UPI003D3131E4